MVKKQSSIHGKDIDVGSLVRSGLTVTGEPAAHVAKAKGKGGKASPESIIKNIKG